VHLTLNVNVPKNGPRDLKYFSQMCGKMAVGLVGPQASKFSPEVLKGKPFSYIENGYEYKLKKENWPTGRGFHYSCYVSAQGSKV